jgi:hypothetical protein
MTKRLTINLTINLVPRKNEAGAVIKSVEIERAPRAWYEKKRITNTGSYVYTVFTKTGVKYHSFWHECAASAMVDQLNNSTGGIGNWNRSQITRRTR